ncbi:MAG: hypothetical protein AAGJ39_07375 [Pseudomonadota bacterium]
MANFVLLIWPVVALCFFAALGREKGMIWSVIVGYLLLPETISIAIPGLPDYEKLSAISLSALIGTFLFRYKPSWPELEVVAPPSDHGPMIAAVWAEILELEADDIPHDKSFRELGGDLRLARKAARMLVERGLKRKTAWGIYKGSTIKDLSTVVLLDGPRQLGSHALAVVFYTLLVILSAAAFVTVMTNLYPLIDGNRTRSGLTLNDAISMISEPVIAMVPFFLAVAILKRGVQHVEVFKAIALCGAAYAAFAFVEVRLSPQMNIWVYGFFQHSWQQHFRNGYRPIVFLDHGLSLGFFLMTATLACMALFRQLKGIDRYRYLLIGLWIFAALALSRNLGAMMLFLFFAPFVLIAPTKLQAWLVAAVAIIFMAYPAIRQAELLPIDKFTEIIAEEISVDRAASLQFRLQNETAMALRAGEKPLFGWGGWGRQRIINEAGADTTVSDGTWIIILGERGWVGYICFFGLLAIPMIYLIFSVRRKEVSPVILTAGLIMAANLIYLVPNSTLSPVGWLLTGTIAGFIRWHLADAKSDADNEDVEELRPYTPYTRFSQDHMRPGLTADS